MLSEEERAQIRQLYHVDHLSIGAISVRMKRHHSSIKRVLFGKAREEGSKVRVPRSSAVLIPMLEFIREKLEAYPGMSRTRLVEILRDKGVMVSVHQLRRFMRQNSLTRKKKAFIKVSLIQGEQAQVDWAHCGEIIVDGARRKLSVFVMVLSYSRMIFARFYVDQCLESFLSAHVHAFRYFGGVPDRLLYDNLKTAVISHVGPLITFNPELIRFASRLCFSLDACNPRSGWEKGRVERAVRYIKESFLLGRSFTDLESANADIMAWCQQTANKRPWPEGREKTVEQVWAEQEAPILRKVFLNDEVVYRQLVLRVRKTPHIRFDCNDYSVPHEYVGESVVVFAGENSLRIFYKDKEIAGHVRSYGKAKTIDSREHIEALLKDRIAARTQARRRLINEHLVNAESFLRKIGEKGESIQYGRRRIYQMLEKYTIDAINSAMAQCIAKNICSVSSLELILRHDVDEAKELDLSSYPELGLHQVRAHSLSKYHFEDTSEDQS